MVLRGVVGWHVACGRDVYISVAMVLAGGGVLGGALVWNALLDGAWDHE